MQFSMEVPQTTAELSATVEKVNASAFSSGKNAVMKGSVGETKHV